MRYRDNQIPPEVANKLTSDQKRSLGIYVPQDKPVASDAANDERELHNEILEHCKLNGFLAFHGSMAHRTFRTAGECDFHLLLPGGLVLFIECKTKNGKLSTDQLGVKMWMEKLGHTYHVVRSYSEFVALVEATLKSGLNSGSSQSSTKARLGLTESECGSVSANAGG